MSRYDYDLRLFLELNGEYVILRVDIGVILILPKIFVNNGPSYWLGGVNPLWPMGSLQGEKNET